MNEDFMSEVYAEYEKSVVEEKRSQKQKLWDIKERVLDKKKEIVKVYIA